MGPLAPLAAIAALAYSKDADAAKFPWLSPERIKQLLARSSYAEDGQKAKSALTMVKPTEMIKTTTTSQSTRDKIAEEAGKFDPYQQQRWKQDSYLAINPRAKKVSQHESRHRLSALARATGRDDPVPIELRAGVAGKGISSKEWEKLSNRPIKGQTYIMDEGDPISFSEITPLAQDTPWDELLKYAHTVDVPLKNVAIRLKPEGPGFHKYDIESFELGGSIPYGKIPPPKPFRLSPVDMYDQDTLQRAWNQYMNARTRGDMTPWNDWIMDYVPEELK
jgi:hypothetical protein